MTKNYYHYEQKDSPGCAIGCALAIGLMCLGAIAIGVGAAILDFLRTHTEVAAVVAIIFLVVILALRLRKDSRGEYYEGEVD